MNTKLQHKDVRMTPVYSDDGDGDNENESGSENEQEDNEDDHDADNDEAEPEEEGRPRRGIRWTSREGKLWCLWPPVLEALIHLNIIQQTLQLLQEVIGWS